jgi:signal-transduction protein with cAMP-binding, CBS, and nucleotidyltransferase domain
MDKLTSSSSNRAVRVQVIDYLKHVEAFKDFNKADLEKVFSALIIEEYAAGDTLIRKGQPARAFCKFDG